MAADSDSERRVDVVWYTMLDDEARPPASILWSRQPLTLRRRECIHLDVLQVQTARCLGLCQPD